MGAEAEAVACPGMRRGRASSVDIDVDVGGTVVGDAIREGMTRLSNGSMASVWDCFRFPSGSVGTVDSSVSCCLPRA